MGWGKLSSLRVVMCHSEWGRVRVQEKRAWERIWSDSEDIWTSMVLYLEELWVFSPLCCWMAKQDYTSVLTFVVRRPKDWLWGLWGSLPLRGVLNLHNWIKFIVTACDTEQVHLNGTIRVDAFNPRVRSNNNKIWYTAAKEMIVQRERTIVGAWECTRLGDKENSCR